MIFFALFCAIIKTCLYICTRERNKVKKEIMKTTEKTKSELITLSIFLFGEIKWVAKESIERGEDSAKWLLKAWRNTYNVC